MKKLLLAIVLIVGCDYAPTEHTHEHEGRCIEKDFTAADGDNGLPIGIYHRCFENWNEENCVDEAYETQINDLTQVFIWIANVDCDEYCSSDYFMIEDINSETRPCLIDTTSSP